MRRHRRGWSALRVLWVLVLALLVVGFLQSIVLSVKNLEKSIVAKPMRMEI